MHASTSLNTVLVLGKLIDSHRSFDAGSLSLPLDTRNTKRWIAAMLEYVITDAAAAAASHSVVPFRVSISALGQSFDVKIYLYRDLGMRSTKRADRAR